MEHNTDRAGDLEVQDYCPYQPQDQLGVPVCYVIISDVDQLDLSKQTVKSIYEHQDRKVVVLDGTYLPVFKEVQCYLYILQFVESHVAFFSGLRTENRCCTNKCRHNYTFSGRI